MFMIAGLLVLGIISLGLALHWYRKVVQMDCFIEPIAERLGEPDITGKKKYTNCGSHQWLMKNVVRGDYLKSAEGFRDFMMNRTMTGTLVLSILLGIIPVVIVYLLFQSYQLIGTSLILVVLSVFIIRGPGELEVSEQLVKWQTEQEDSLLDLGDLAYARISQNTMKSWTIKLVTIGIVCIVLSPWGEALLPALAFVFTLFLGFVYESIFLPLSMYSMPLALMVFFTVVPFSLTMLIIGVRLAQRKMQKDYDDFKI